ncbi:MAG: TMEM175 family protein [Mucilaginibacter sp.]
MKNIKTAGKPSLFDAAPERLFAFSDGIFAIIITIMVLELKRPEEPTFDAIFKLWPAWLSYGVSYLFIAIVWINHHYLLRNCRSIRLPMMWANFLHLFSVSLIPFLTDWVAETRLASVPVVLYAFVFLTVNLTYYWLVWESALGGAIDYRNDKKNLHFRSHITLCLFFAAMVLSYWFPQPDFGLIVFCLLLYLRPQAPDLPQKIKAPY